jgi:hypothetical protein
VAAGDPLREIALSYAAYHSTISRLKALELAKCALYHTCDRLIVLTPMFA